MAALSYLLVFLTAVGVYSLENLHHARQPLDTTCAVMAKIATTATNAMENQIKCSSSPPPCNSTNCNVVSNNDSLVFAVLPCSKPPAISLTARAKDGTMKFTGTYNRSVSKVEAPIGSSPVVMNITIKQDPQMKTLGVGINATIVVDDKLVPVEFVPFVKVPLDRTHCPIAMPQQLSLFSGKTLYKQGPRLQVPTLTLPAMVAESESLMSPRPLKTACDVLPELVSSLNSIPSSPFDCTLSRPPCNRVFCNVSGGDLLMINHLPCHNPPAQQIVVRNSSNGVLTNITISRSGPVSINFTNLTVPTNYTVVQHSMFLTLGLSVNATVPNVGNTEVLPYMEIPMNRSGCLGAKTPPPMCAAMQNLAQYLNVYMANITRDINQPWDCSLSSPCTNITCTSGNMSAAVVLDPCSKTVTLYMPPNSPNSTQQRVVMITRSGSMQLDDTDTLISQLYYNASTQTLGLQVSIVYQDIQNESLSMSVAVIPFTSIPLNLTTCNTTRDDGALISPCEVMAGIASVATNAIEDQLKCTSAGPPCNSVKCVVLSSNGSLVFSVSPCSNPPAFSLVARSQNRTLKFNETYSSSAMNVNAPIGDNPAILNITVNQHPQMLTLGVGINALIVVGDQLVPVDFFPYVEIPLSRKPCPLNLTSPTCQVMSEVAKYVSYFSSNDSHKPQQCQVIEEDLCNTISCSSPERPTGFYNMSFLPCGRRIGYNTLSGHNETSLNYNITVFNSSIIQYNEHTIGNVTLMQQRGKKAVTFQLDLYANSTTYIGTEVPRVMIPLDASMCNATNPPGNHTHNNTETLIDTCEVMPLLAKATTGVLGDTVTCVSSTRPNCNTVSCRDRSNNVTLSYTVLTCRSPPAIQIINRNAHGNVTYNMTFVNTSKSVSADILGWDHPAILNVTLVQHRSMLTMGLAIDVMGGNNVDSTSLLPYFEIPVNGPECNVCTAPIYPPGFMPPCDVLAHRWTFNTTSGRCEEFSFHPCGQPTHGFNVFNDSRSCSRACANIVLDTPTCRTMNNVAQYMTVFLGNLTHSPDRTPSCRAVRPYCNSFLCTLPNGGGFYNNSFLPCDNPIGFSSVVVDHLSNISRNYTQYQSGTYLATETTSVDITLDQLGTSLVGFELILNTNETGKVVSLQEMPYVQVPLNTSVCNTGPGPHPNTSHTSNNSLISTCEVLPLVAQQASNALPGSITCTSSKVPNCNSISCLVLDTHEILRFTFLPCARPPAVRFTVSNHTVTYMDKHLNESATVTASIGGEDTPLYFNINHHSTNLSLGLSVSAMTGGDGNVTFMDYVEVPLDRSACPLKRFMGPKDSCEAMFNASQYMNYAISSVTGMSTDCVPAKKCQEVTCSAGQRQSSLTLTILNCEVPQLVQAQVRDATGAITARNTISDRQSLTWDIGGSQLLNVNISLQHPGIDTLDLQATVNLVNGSAPVTLVPPVDIPLNLSGCRNITLPTYSNYSLINACNIMPVIARLAFPPAGVASIMCSSSAPPNCSSITCSAAGSRETVVFTVEPCYNPPVVTVERFINGSSVFKRSSSHSIEFSFGSAETMRATVIQHTQKLSIGFKVDVVSDDFEASFIPYREIPVDHYGCTGALVSPTCKVMNNIAQYMTVFLANYTTNVNSTPDCYADRKSLCNNITCIMPGSGERYNYSFNSCEDPISFNIRHTFSDYTVVSDDAFTDSQDLQVMNLNSSRLTFNHIDAKTVQIQIASTVGDLIPLVTVPLDVQLCRDKPTPTSSTSSTTRQPTDGPSSDNIALYVAVPVAGLVVIVILILLAILAYSFISRRKLSDEPYNYRPLSDRDGEEDVEEDEGEQDGGRVDFGHRRPLDIGGDDLEKGETDP